MVGPDYILLCSGSPSERAFGEMIGREFGIPCQVGEILYSRGVTTLEQAHEFLYPQLTMLPPPDSMKGMQEAVSCIIENCCKNKPIFIHGDYDVDGISATALLVSFFKEIGYEAFFCIPNRLEESYGLSFDSIDRLIAQRAKKGGVIISVDCGITAIQEVAYARQFGFDVVVTDHHEPQEVLPRANAILNPKQDGCTFPCAFLSGVGVAFFLIVALRKAMGASINLKKYLDLVALGTVADVVPLVGVNRILVRAGLEVLSAKFRFGVLSLCECCGLEAREILSEDISFKLAPRINAAGRLGFPQKGVELLLTENILQARGIAGELEQMNATRKQLESSALALVEAKCSEQVEAKMNGLSIYQQDCHPGVLGILASRIADRYNRPNIIFTDDRNNGPENLVKGSGRSIKGINLFHVLEQCSSVIEQFGGHAMAVGLTLKKENLEHFRQVFNQYVSLLNNKLNEQSKIIVDYKIKESALLSKDFVKALQWLQPFGEGNTEPTFLLTEQKLTSLKMQREHLIFQVQGGDQVFHGIGFHLARIGLNHVGPVDLVFQLKRSWFRGVGRDQINALNIITT
jgi:single-stranded-DNA-specific exonuclease